MMWNNNGLTMTGLRRKPRKRLGTAVVGAFTLGMLVSTTIDQDAARAADEVDGEAAFVAEPAVRIVSWDLHDLWQTPGQPLRAGAVVRSDNDFVALRAKAASLRADVIALQGVGSPRAARRLFPSRAYYVVFSRELAIRQQRDRDMLSNPARRRVYNAIAIRRGSRLRVLAREQILETADPSPALGVRRPQGQSALAIKLRINRTPFWVLSARLVDGCDAIADAVAFHSEAAAEKKTEPSSRSAACTALHDQVRLLKGWASLKTSKQETVVAGLALPRASGTSGTIAWTALTHGDTDEIAKVHRAQIRAAAQRRATASQWSALTNPLIGSAIAGTDKRAQQPNTVELTGPSRPAGQRLLKRATKQSDGGNFVVDALSDFARAALKSKNAEVGPTTSKPSNAADVTKPENTAPPEHDKKAPLKAKRVFVQFPDVAHVDGCRSDQFGQNFLVLDRAFHARTEGVHFGAILERHVSSSVATGSRTDCAVYLDIPRRRR